MNTELTLHQDMQAISEAIHNGMVVELDLGEAMGRATQMLQAEGVPGAVQFTVMGMILNGVSKGIRETLEKHNG